MKACTEFQALLDLFLDGELSDEEMGRVADHLDRCEACRAYIDDGLAIRAALPRAEETAVPEGFAESVMEAVRRSPQLIPPAGRRTSRPWVRTFASLAAACFVLAVALGALPELRGGGSGMDTAAVTASSAPSSFGGADAPADAPAGAPETRMAEACLVSPEEAPADAPAGDMETPIEETPADADSWEGNTFAVNPAAAPSADSAANGAAEDLDPAESEAAQEEKEKTAGRAGIFQVEIPAEQEELLAPFPLRQEESGREYYALTAEEYRTLAAALEARGVAPEPLPEGAETVQVSVR